MNKFKTFTIDYTNELGYPCKGTINAISKENAIKIFCNTFNIDKKFINDCYLTNLNNEF